MITVGTTKTDKGVTRLTLNGKIVKLHGYNRHTAWPDTGVYSILSECVFCSFV